MKKTKLLVASCILGTSLLFSTSVFAKTSAIVITGTDGKMYEYNYSSLKNSALVYEIDGSTVSGAKLYDDFLTRKSSINAFYDDTRKSYVDFNTISKEAENSPQNFDLDSFLDNSSTPTISLTSNLSQVTTDSGNNVLVDGQPTTSTPAVDMTTLKLNTTSVPYTTIVTFKLNVSDPQDYTVTVKGTTAQYNSTTNTFGAGVNGVLTASDFTTSDFVISNKNSTIHRVELVSTSLTQTDTNTATFQYKVVDENGEDITKTVPASEISAVSPVSSKIVLDPSTGTGTITFESSYDANAIVTLTDTVYGTSATLNYENSDPGQTTNPSDDVSSSVAEIDITSTDLMKTSTNTATFSYKILDKNGADITKTIPASKMMTSAWIGSSAASVTLDPSTETGTVTYNFSDTDKGAIVQLACVNGIVGQRTLSIDASETGENTKVNKIEFISTSLTQTGTNTATFQYKVLDENGEDITKTVPASEISAVSSATSVNIDPSTKIVTDESVGSKVSLDPSTGTGTITLDSSYDANKAIVITLIDEYGTSATESFGEQGSAPTDTEPSNTDNLPIAQIDITSDKLTRTGTNTATFNYKILDNNGTDITKTVPVSDISFEYESITPSETNPIINLDPSTETGTITYNFSDTNQNMTIILVGYNGVVGQKTLSFDTSETDKNTKVNKIEFVSTTLTQYPPDTPTFQYKILDQNGTDITKTVPVSEINASVSGGSSIELNPLEEIGTITVNSSNINQSITVTLSDKINNVSASIVYPAPNSGTSVKQDSKVNKIEITSTALGVAANTTSGAAQENGYATFKVYDQYGNDITNSQLGNNIVFKCNVGTITSTNGLITLTPNQGIDLSKLSSVVITATDSATGVSTSATLSINQ